MNALALIQVVITLLSGVLSAATKSGLAKEIVSGVQAAITALEQVHSTPVTKQQLDDLRVTPKW